MNLPRIDRDSVKPGDRITVLVGGIPYETEINEHGTQRFIIDPDNALVRRLRNRSDGQPTRAEGDIADLNEMAIRYHQGEFTKREYAEMNIALGYSLGGFEELSSFEDMDIDNPLDEAGLEYDADDTVTMHLIMSRAAARVFGAVLEEGGEALNRAANGPQAARDEVRAGIDGVLAQIAKKVADPT